MTWMKHIDRIKATGIGTGLHIAGSRLHRGIHRVIGSVSSHVRHNVSSTAVAQRNDVPARDLTADDEHDMTLIGYLAFLDPPKASAKAAVQELGDLGAPWDALTDPAQRALFALIFQTGWFVESMWTQTLVIHLLRTERLPFVQSRPAASLTLLTALGVGAVTLMPYAPGVREALGLVPLPAAFFGVLAAMMAGYLLFTSIAKAWYVRAHGELL